MNVFRNETRNVKLLNVVINVACKTWMFCERGEGEEEIENQGWSRVKVSSQGTDLEGQWPLRMRANEAYQKLSTGCTKDSNSTPLFSSLQNLVIHHD